MGWYFNVAAQDSDSLQSLDFTELLFKIENTKDNKDLLSGYLKTFLNKAKSEGDLENIIKGYKNYIYFSDSNSVVYADSMVMASHQTNSDSQIGSAYLTKGILHYSLKEYKEALDHYLKAQDYILKTDDDYLKNKVKYNIAHLKYYLGNYNEALMLFRECIIYFEIHNLRAYLNTLHSIAICHSRMGNYGTSSEYTKRGIDEGERLMNQSMKAYFMHQEGINHFYRNNYGLAIDYINKAIPDIEQNNDFANVTVGNFYIGKSYLRLQKPERAKEHFEEVVKVFEETSYITPDLRESLEFLIKHFEQKSDWIQKLYYIERLLEVDSVLHINYRYLSEKIHKDYDTKDLERKRDEIINQLEREKKQAKILIIGIVILIILLIVIWCRFLKNKRLYKQRFEELMNKNIAEPNYRKELKQSNENELDINPEVNQQLLLLLEKFEYNKKFLEKDLSLAKLAALFNSNTKYLSKVILYNRNKGFVEYINDLKIDYIITVLKEEKRFRNYTNAALAEEAGFSSTQRFVKAFVSRTGISPSYFVKELGKIQRE
jgi:AraC-like DNA-binding protein